MGSYVEAQTVADAIYQARHMRRLTQSQLAELAGVSLPSVQRHESGRDVSSAVLDRYGRALGVTFVLGGEAPATGVEPVTYRFLTGDAA